MSAVAASASQKYKIPLEDLREGLRRISPAVAKEKTLIKALTSVVFRRGSITAHNGSLTAKCALETGVAEPFAVPGMTLSTILESVRGKEISIVVIDGNVKFSVGRTRVTLANTPESLAFKTPAVATENLVTLHEVGPAVKKCQPLFGATNLTPEKLGITLEPVFDPDQTLKRLALYATNGTSLLRTMVKVGGSRDAKKRFSQTLSHRRVIWPIDFCSILAQFTDASSGFDGNVFSIQPPWGMICSQVILSEQPLDFKRIIKVREKPNYIPVSKSLIACLERAKIMLDRQWMESPATLFTADGRYLSITTKNVTGLITDRVPFAYPEFSAMYDPVPLLAILTSGGPSEIAFLGRESRVQVRQPSGTLFLLASASSASLPA
jgi:hypothetical protein